MKSVREELAEALAMCKRNLFNGQCHNKDEEFATCLSRDDDWDMRCTYCTSNAALARHAAEPDDRPRLLAFLRAYRALDRIEDDNDMRSGRVTTKQYAEALLAQRACFAACADIDTEEA